MSCYFQDDAEDSSTLLIPSGGVLHHDEDRIWDELNHEQHREIQQYRENLSSSLSSHTSLPRMDKCRKRVSDAMLEFTNYLKYRMPQQQQQQQQQQHGKNAQRSSIETTPTNLSEFGLEEGCESFISPLEVGEEDTITFDTGNESEEFCSSEKKKDFVFLSRFRLTPENEGWGAVSNLDLFFTSLYNYYYHRGWKALIGKAMVELFSLLFTFFLSVFLFAFLDWGSLFHCQNENSCQESFQLYILQKPFHSLTVWRFIVLLYTILCSIYAILSIASFLILVQNALRTKSFYEHKLGISSRKLEGGAVEWDDVVQKLIQLQESGDYRMIIHGKSKLDALVIAQRIMRKENFMVAFWNLNVLDLRIPFKKQQGKEMFYSKSLEWSIHFCVLSYMYNYKYQLRPAFYTDPSALKRRFILLGILQAIFMPFLLLFMMLYFFLQNTHQWKSTKQYLGPRDWSNLSKWSFREFNELPHIFERRLAPSYEAAENYLSLFTPSPLMTSLGRIIVFISGSLLAVLLALGTINDSILLHVKLGPWNLFWYVGIISICYTTGQGLIPNENQKNPNHYKYYHIHSTHTNAFAEMDAALAKVANCTHYYPEDWKSRAYKSRTKADFSSMFQNKARLFLSEIWSIVLSPFILCISLPSCAEKICKTVQRVKVDVPGVGDVCGYSCFDFDAFADENWRSVSSDGGDNDDTTTTSTYSFPTNKPTERLKTKQGKLEKSFFNFRSAHPPWKCPTSGQNLLDRVTSYQQTQQELDLAKEQQPHIDAAARQLETLRALERKRFQSNSNHNFLEETKGETTISSSTEHLQAALPQDSNPLLSQSTNHNQNSQSLMHYADTELSTELRRLLIDPDISIFASVLQHDPSLRTSRMDASSIHRTRSDADLQTQYMWLDRYHSHVIGQQPQTFSQSISNINEDDDEDWLE